MASPLPIFWNEFFGDLGHPGHAARDFLCGTRDGAEHNQNGRHGHGRDWPEIIGVSPVTVGHGPPPQLFYDKLIKKVSHSVNLSPRKF